MGRVPALVIDGHTLGESVAIMEYLEETRPDRPLLPKAPHEKAVVRQLVEIINSGVQPLQNIGVLNYISEELKGDRKTFAVTWITKGIAAFEEIIKDTHGKYCYGDNVTMADAVLAPQVYACSRFEIDMTPFPTIRAVMENLNELPEFKAAHANSQIDAEV